jgi:uncharacterized protein (UPF0335 family)
VRRFSSHSTISSFRSTRWPPLPPPSEEPATKFAKDQLKAIIERIERLEEERDHLGFIRDVTRRQRQQLRRQALRTIVRLQADANEQAEEETI